MNLMLTTVTPFTKQCIKDLKSILIDSSTLSSHVPNKTDKHTIPNVILHRHTAQVSTVLPGYNAVVYTVDSNILQVFPVPRFF
jgi:hypothetical protein